MMMSSSSSTLPRHWQHHERLHATLTSANSTQRMRNSYPGCAMLAAHAKSTAAPTTATPLNVGIVVDDDEGTMLDVNAQASQPATARMLEVKTKASEDFIKEFAESVHARNSVSAQLAFGRFSPRPGESIMSIFAAYSGAAQ